MTQPSIGAVSFFLRYPNIATATAPNTLSLACYTVAVELTPSTEDIDVGVMCNPSLSDQGRTTYTAVATFLWEPALYDLLLPKVGLQGEAQLVTWPPGDQTKYVRWLTRFAAMPWGRFEVGQRVEVELPLAVLDTPTWVDAP